MTTPSLLTKCIECGATVSTSAGRCPSCGTDPMGTPCRICAQSMSTRDQVKLKLPQEMGRGEGGEIFRRYHEMTVHGKCWNAFVSQLFPANSIAASCPACNTPRPTPLPTDIDFPCQWTCLTCGHPCSLEVQHEPGARSAGWRYSPNGMIIGAFRTNIHTMVFVGFVTSDVVRREKTGHGGLLFMASAMTVDHGGVGSCLDGPLSFPGRGPTNC